MNQVEYVSFLNILGDNKLKLGGKENYESALECYMDASQILREVCGEESMDFLLSLVDIGDVYLETKELEKAKSFYLLTLEKIISLFGPNCIFMQRINSALSELYTAMGTEEFKNETIALDNLRIAKETYGDQSIYLLSYFLQAISASV